MDRKTSKSHHHSNGRSSSTDSNKKTSQDIACGKQWPRNGRRREHPSNNNINFSSASSSAPKNVDPTRNNSIARANFNGKSPFDRKPRARGSGVSGCVYVGRTEASQLEAETGSVFQSGSKKQNLNSKSLQFNFVHSHQGRYVEDQLRYPNANNTSVIRRHHYNKEHFLQANCQFIVNATGDYRQYLNNPDVLVNWELVEQINMQLSECPSCPICLYPPSAAKITRCGHIYCWSCLLHYLSLSDKAWRKCPICYEAVYKKDLKSAVAVVHQTFNINDTITFKLMKRIKGSLIAYPADNSIGIKKAGLLFDVNESHTNQIYSKLLSANQMAILAIIQREYSELIGQRDNNEDCPENCFIEEALNLLEERKTLTNVVKSSLDVGQVETGFEKLDIGANVHVPPLEDKFYYFYQAADGQHIYLHAINVKMLETTFGSLQFAPQILSGVILEKEANTMTESLRKRLRCLQHLPVSSQFEVAEIQLSASDVNDETLHIFREQLKNRRQRRQCRASEESKRSKRIDLEQNKRFFGRCLSSSVSYCIDSRSQFPDFEWSNRQRSESETTQDNAQEISSTVENDIHSTASNSASASSILLTNQSTTPTSFANMLKSSKTDAGNWPLLNCTNSAEQSSLTTLLKKNTTAKWGIRHSFSALEMSESMKEVKISSSHENESDTESGSAIVTPVTGANLGDEVFRALQNAKKDNSSSAIAEKDKGRKKKTKTLLYTTAFTYSPTSK